MPNGRYDLVMEAKILKTKELLRTHEQTCDNLSETVRRYIPEIFK